VTQRKGSEVSGLVGLCWIQTQNLWLEISGQGRGEKAQGVLREDGSSDVEKRKESLSGSVLLEGKQQGEEKEAFPRGVGGGGKKKHSNDGDG